MIKKMTKLPVLTLSLFFCLLSACQPVLQTSQVTISVEPSPIAATVTGLSATALPELSVQAVNTQQPATGFIHLITPYGLGVIDIASSAFDPQINAAYARELENGLHALTLPEHGDKVLMVYASPEISLSKSDINLNAVQPIWRDETHFLPIKDKPADDYIAFTRAYWLVEGSVVMLHDDTGQETRQVYLDVTSGVVEYSHIGCKTLYHDAPLGDFWLGCENDAGAPFYINSAAGLVYTLPAEGALVTGDLAYARFSPDGSGVVYQTGHGAAELQSKDGRTSLPVTLPEKLFTHAWQVVKWSANGQHVAVFGYGQGEDACPPLQNMLTGDWQDQPCWQVFDVITAESIWQVDQGLMTSPASGDPTSCLLALDVAFSPDGRYFLHQVMMPPMRWVLVSPVDDAATHQTIYDWESEQLYWE